MTNWVKMFTDILLFYAYVGLNQVRLLVFVQSSALKYSNEKEVNVTGT